MLNPEMTGMVPQDGYAQFEWSNWVEAVKSAGNGECVLVAQGLLRGLGRQACGVVGIRDRIDPTETVRPDEAILVVWPDRWGDFLKDVKGGRYNLPGVV